MPTRRYTPEQIIHHLREAEVLLSQGMTAENAARQIGVSVQTYYRWRKEYGGMRSNQAKPTCDKNKVPIGTAVWFHS